MVTNSANSNRKKKSGEDYTQSRNHELWLIGSVWCRKGWCTTLGLHAVSSGPGRIFGFSLVREKSHPEHLLYIYIMATLCLASICNL
jgi:hypothetical protein